MLASEGTTVLSFRSIDRAGNVEGASLLSVRIDKTDPTITITADPTVLWPPNGRRVVVTVSGSAVDEPSGLAGVSYEIVDEYGLAFSIPPRVLEGRSMTWEEAVALEARRDGSDRDGRRYTLIATGRDVAGRTAAATVGVLVPHDSRKSKAR